MAIQIMATPVNDASFNHELIYVVSEATKTADPVTYPNYKYVADVYIVNSANVEVLVTRLKNFPDPVNKFGVFDVGPIVRSYALTKFDPFQNINASIFFKSGNGDFLQRVVVKFGEEVGFITTTNLVSDTERKFFNYYYSRSKYYEPTFASLENKFLTDRPVTGTFFIDDNHIFIPIKRYSTQLAPINLNVIVDGDPFNAVNINISPIIKNDECLNLNISPSQINAAAGIPLININTKEYAVYSPENSSSFTLFKTCETIYKKYNVHFLNKYGGFETKSFHKLSRETLSIKRKSFTKLFSRVARDGGVSFKSPANVYNETSSVYSTDYTEKIKLNTDNLSDGEYLWLEQLILSPMVFLEDEGVFYPCIITDNNYERKKYINDGISNMTIDLDFGVQLNTQYR